MGNSFTHMLVSSEGAFGSVVVGTAYMIGTMQECRVYQMLHGLRAKTQIIPF